MRKEAITGFILAGGHSLRMGTDKAQIQWADGTLLTHAVKAVSAVIPDVFIVGGDKAVPGLRILPDSFPGCGPLSGIQAALGQTASKWNFIVAVDMPLLNAPLVAFIADRAMGQEVDAVVPMIGGAMQPLPAVYNRSLLPQVDGALQDGEFSVHRLLEQVKRCIIEEKELIQRGFSPEMFLNVNTPVDLERARLIAKNLNV